MAHLGCAAPGAAEALGAAEAFAPGTICERAMRSGEGNYLANLVLSTPGKVIVLVTAATLLGGGIYGTTQLRQVLHFFRCTCTC